jgi:hypothetical protein
MPGFLAEEQIVFFFGYIRQQDRIEDKGKI